MNKFFLEYIERLKIVKTPEDVIALYCWFWDKKDEIPQAIEAANREMGLNGQYELKPDLPCLSVGSMRGLLILAANPSWNEFSNKIENDYCLTSQKNYCSVMSDFFELHPKVVKKRIRWWGKPISFIQLLPAWQQRFGQSKNSAEKWQNAHTSKLIGGWDLFPFHSESDGITQLALNEKGPTWLKNCMKESLNAAFRLSPEIILVASKSGCELTKKLLGPEVYWHEQVLSPQKKKTSVYYCRFSETTEIIAIPHQIFSAHRTFTNTEFFQAIDLMRTFSKQADPKNLRMHI